MAMTLLEAMKYNEGETLRNTIIEMFARSSPLLAALPFVDIPGGSYAYRRQGSLPGVAFRAINQGFDESVGVIVPESEMLRIAGGDLDVDKALIDFNGPGIRAQTEQDKVTALGLYIAKKLVKGDSLLNPLEFDGLQNRITGSQLVEAGSTDGGDPLSLLKLDELIDQVRQPTHLIMAEGMRRLLTAASRNQSVGGHVRFEIDQFGRQVTRYNDLPILELGEDELGARVLDFNEVGSGGATASATSIYCVSLREGACFGIQNGIMSVRDLGEIDAKPVWRTRVDWNIGFVTAHPKGAARLRGISNAAVTA